MLIAAAADRNRSVRASVSKALVNVDPDRTALPELLESLRNGDAPARLNAAAALPSLARSSDMPSLAQALDDPQIIVRRLIVEGTGRSSVETKELVLVPALEDADAYVRRLAAAGFQRTGPDFFDQSDNLHVSSNYSSLPSFDSMGSLLPHLRDPDPAVRKAVSIALRARISHLRQRATKLPFQSRIDRIAVLDKWMAQLDRLGIEARGVRQEIDTTRRQLTPPPLSRSFIDAATQLGTSLWLSIRSHPISSSTIAYLLLLAAAYLCVPLWLHGASEWLHGLGDNALVVRGISIPLRHLLGISFLAARNRVHDAWVSYYAPIVRDRFAGRSVVLEREYHASLPAVIVEGRSEQSHPQVTAATLRPFYVKQPFVLAIEGEGGIGKTSLACQIGKWACAERVEERLAGHLMLPVLLEGDIDFKGNPDVKQAIVRTIGGALASICGLTRDLSDGFIERLLRSRRLAVIIDGFAEVEDETRRLVHPEQFGFPIKSLVITSRREELKRSAGVVRVRPQRVDPSHLHEFIAGYLRYKGVRGSYDDEAVERIRHGIVRLVENRRTTVLVARLFLEQVRTVDGKAELPDVTSVPELMRKYLHWVARSGGDKDEAADLKLEEGACRVAWECTRSKLRAEPVSLEQLGRKLEEGEQWADILVARGVMVRSGPLNEAVRFRVEPLCEYLAAMHVVRTYGGRRRQWEALKARARKLGDEGLSTEGFLRIVEECATSVGVECRLGIMDDS